MVFVKGATIPRNPEATAKKKSDRLRKLPKVIRDYILLAPPRYHGVLARAYLGVKPALVKAKCLDCSVYQIEEITNCTVVTCPLHKRRPYQDALDAIEDAEESPLDNV